ncbi:hemin receptor protein [Salmonella enterica subsp. diarizonae]|nr:hemin receptor protein [Salmonella enterica subsp. diarizonae]
MTITATGTEISAFEVPSVVNVIDNHAAYTRTAFTAGDFLRGIAGITPVGVGRTNGQTFNLRVMTKAVCLLWWTVSDRTVGWIKAAPLSWSRH